MYKLKHLYTQVHFLHTDRAKIEQSPPGVGARKQNIPPAVR